MSLSARVAYKLNQYSRYNPTNLAPKMYGNEILIKLRSFVFLLYLIHAVNGMALFKRSISDQSVKGYFTERTCWWNEVCKEEFQSQFKCKCPEWSFCRAPGRYYNAFCSMTQTGYIWTQPGLRGS